MVIDCFSKYVWPKPLRTKFPAEVAQRFEKILKEGRRPTHAQSDQGLGYFNNAFSKVMKKYNINHYNTYRQKKVLAKCVIGNYSNISFLIVHPNELIFYLRLFKIIMLKCIVKQ